MTLYASAIRVAHRAYKLTLSPWFGRQCRFLPTCSDYAAEALITHGPVRGGYFAARRLCRCHPFGGSGYDPVPTRVAQNTPTKNTPPKNAPESAER